MKFNDERMYRFVMGLFVGFTGLLSLILFCSFFWGVLMGIVEWPCLVVGFFFCIPLSAKYQSASGELTPEGVYVRHYFVRRFYAWSEIRQAGILFRRGKGGGNYDIILVKPGEHDTLFLLRNLFRLIHIPDETEFIDFVIAHLGPLAYDQRRAERQ